MLAKVAERRELIIEALKEKPGTVLSCSKIGDIIGSPSSTVHRDIQELMKNYHEIKLSMNTKDKGYVWNETAPEDPEPPKTLEYSDEGKNASGCKDPTARAAISGLAEKVVREAEVWECRRSNLETEIYVTIRGAFIGSGTSSERVTVIPAYESFVKGALYLMTSDTGKGYYVYPYHVCTKPTKYFTRRVGKMLPCDMDTLKHAVAVFLELPERIKIIEKRVPVSNEKRVPVSVEKPVVDEEWQKRFEELKEQFTEMRMKYMLCEQKAEIYKDLIDKLFSGGVYEC